MSQRNLACIAGEQHQRQSADRREENLAGEIEIECGGEERERDKQDGKQQQTRALKPCLCQRKVLRITGAKIAAGPGHSSRHGRAPRAFRTNPTAARSASQSAPGTAQRPTTADRYTGSTAPPPRR